MAFAHRPRLLVLDEPSTGLDAHYVGVLRALLAGDAGQTRVLVSHSAVGLETTDSIVRLAGGRVVATGARDEVVFGSIGRHRAEITFRDAAAVTACEAALVQRPGLCGLTRRGEHTLVVLADDELGGALQPFLGHAAAFSVRENTYVDYIDGDTEAAA